MVAIFDGGHGVRAGRRVPVDHFGRGLGPARAKVSLPRGCLLYMAAYRLSSYIGVKMVGVFPGNAELGVPGHLAAPRRPCAAALMPRVSRRTPGPRLVRIGGSSLRDIVNGHLEGRQDSGRRLPRPRTEPTSARSRHTVTPARVRAQRPAARTVADPASTLRVAQQFARPDSSTGSTRSRAGLDILWHPVLSRAHPLAVVGGYQDAGSLRKRFHTVQIAMVV